MIPKINSSHGSETRNIINTAIDSINVQGKTIQDLVAKGQLTSAQYATLIQAVNGLISKGNVSVHDINKNLGKLDGTFFSSDFLRQLNDGEINTTNVLDGSLTTSKYALKSVTPEKTSFFERSRNLFQGYENWTLESGGIRGVTHLYNGRLAVVPVRPNTSYYVKNYEVEKSNRLGIATSTEYPVFGSDNYFRDVNIIAGPSTTMSLDEYSFTTGSNDHYAYIYPANTGAEPVIQVEEGDYPTDYVQPLVIPQDIINYDTSDLRRSIARRTAVVVETSNGYPPRPDAASVQWIGISEPTDAETFDEWRETKGLTYFEDFDSYSIGSNAPEWSEPWVKGNKEILSSTNVPGDSNGKILYFEPSSSGRHAIAWDDVKKVGNYNDVEVYIRARISGNIAAQLLSAVLRGSGSSGSETGYVVGARPFPDGRIVISKYENGSSDIIAEAETGIRFNNYYHMVARAEGPNVKVKVWQEGEPEKSGWDLEVTDTSIPSGDFVGLFNFHTAPMYIDKIGIATGGMRAPRKKLI